MYKPWHSLSFKQRLGIYTDKRSNHGGDIQATTKTNFISLIDKRQIILVCVMIDTGILLAVANLEGSQNRG